MTRESELWSEGGYFDAGENAPLIVVVLILLGAALIPIIAKADSPSAPKFLTDEYGERLSPKDAANWKCRDGGGVRSIDSEYRTNSRFETVVCEDGKAHTLTACKFADGSIEGRCRRSPK